jgi:hypothetical protein
MDRAASLRRLGFRRWYERTLIEAHLWLVSCFLALVLAVALFETHNETTIHAQRFPLLVAAVFSVIGAWWAYRRYFRTLLRAERFGEAASCPQCGAYGKFSILSASEDNSGDLATVTACCRKCRKQWRLEEYDRV